MQRCLIERRFLRYGARCQQQNTQARCRNRYPTFGAAIRNDYGAQHGFFSLFENVDVIF
ncbi:MAG: hypothetical protein ACU83V_08160 [Gammaproteobacteria bacterium]